MIADLRPYREYRLAEPAWLGEVPSHWTIRRIKYILREVDLRSKTGKEQLLRISQYNGVTQRRRADGLDEPDTRADSLVGYKRVALNDLVINIMLAWNGSMGVSRYEGIASPAYCVYRFGRKLQPWYFHNLFRSPAYKARIKALSTGVVESRLRLYSDDLGRIEAMIPPPAEQAAIVRFLDWANGRFERAIRAKRKVIALLSEQKRVIIQRAITRGLKPSVSLAPSGNAWLGDVPRHWEIVRSGSMFRLFGGYAFPGTGFFRDQSDTTLPLLLTPVNFDPEGGLRFGRNSTIRFRGEVPRQFKLEKGSLVTVLTDLSSKRLILGRAGFIDVEGVLLNQRTARVDIHASMRAKLSTKYLCLVLNASPVREQTIATSRGSTVFHTSPSRMLAARWPLPPIEEQHAIVEELESTERQHRITCGKLRDEIEFLREYQTRLIADVVSGKLDVRDAATRVCYEAERDIVEDDNVPSNEPEAADEEPAA
jgi:type I restriction enzyme S subunit